VATHRVFFALSPDPALREALAGFATALAVASRGRATAADSIHLTLAFIGDVDEARLATLQTIGEGVRCEPFVMTLDRIGGFRRAGVAFVAPAQVPGELAALEHRLREALVERGFALDARAFAPHVTLARHCMNMPPAAPCEPTLPWSVDSFVLWRSTTAPGGARYTELARWRVGDGALR
jgi:RNA 2',3'-cyclic 3'-phosphodiesterase